MAMFSLLQAHSSAVLLQAHEERAFLSWMRETNNFFVGEDYHMRLGIWLSKKRFVQEFNKNGEFRVALNQFSHLTHDEYKSLLGFKNIQTGREIKEMKPTNDVPASVDWREKGCVNKPKDQGNCGSCWAFSSIQSIEGIWAKEKGKLYQLSEQNLVDCDKTSNGCDGGLMDNAFQHVVNNQGGYFNLESDYPYVGKRNKKCLFNEQKGYAKIQWDFQLKPGDEEALKTATANIGPIAVAIDASHLSFETYYGGIYNPKKCSTKNLDHAVGVVGYGTEEGTDFWIVRNSWGDRWGENGYIRMIRNRNNKCGIATMAYYPELA